MQRISLAPVLSATLSRDSCWIIGISPGCRAGSQTLAAVSLAAGGCSGCEGSALRGLLGLLEDLQHAPALRGRQRPGLHDQHPVAHAALVLLVVDLELRGAPQDLAVQRVLDPVLDRDHDGLVHLVADDQALADLAPSATLCRLLLAALHSSSLTHAAPSFSAPGAVRMPSSRSRTTV